MKRLKANLEKIEINKKYALKEAISLVKELSNAKFDETIEIHKNITVILDYVF